MKVSNLFIVIALLLILPLAANATKAADISGTWVGSTEVPGMEESDEITLVLTKDGETYNGTITDSMGMAQDAELKEISFEGNTLSFQFSVDAGDGPLQIDVSLSVEGKNMSGSWSSEDGTSASMELKKQK